MKPVNQLDQPRVLIWIDEDLRSRFEFSKELPGTYRVVSSLDEIEMDEWDALITDEPLARYFNGATTHVFRDVPETLCVFRVIRWNSPNRSRQVERLTGPQKPEGVSAWLSEVRDVPGNHAYPGTRNLPDAVSRLTKSDLEPVVSGRHRQFGVQASKCETSDDYAELGVDVHLFGPRQIVISGNHTRPNRTSVWFVPEDVPDFQPWLELALRNWHDLMPTTFPGVPGWADAADWMTSAEAEAYMQLREAESRFEEVKKGHEAEIATLREVFEAVASDAIGNERLLLTGQDFPLQESVLRALRFLGYDVQDMDGVFPDREPREDYRIRDPDAPDWIAIGDATGVAKGAKTAKIGALGGFSLKYVLDEGATSPPRQWLLVNRKIHQDPNTRGEVYRDDDVMAFAASLGLAIDTVALFLLVRAVSDATVSAAEVRTWLRDRTGQLLISDVREWLPERGGTAD
ncbi:hypothetical protein [Prescottella equi]|uniref:hypothetical protein n=1 Tax=Rhodococcus hoagii TaxID=43767 RepID=UPI0012F9ACDF|nr:hypothetical protein [Prescottella equi]